MTAETRDEEKYLPWMALARVEGLGPLGFKKLVERFGDARKAFSASESDLGRVPGLGRKGIRGLLRFSGWDEVRKELHCAFDAGIEVLPYDDPDYPPRLRAIADPPSFLYVKGEIRPEDANAIAVVGSRNASPYGLKMARDLCHALAALGFTVVSGMARGIDGQAHEAALSAGGRTIAVLGSGADVVYPREHKALYQRIGENGAVISEFPLGTPPLAQNFPYRNRLISGLALGVVVVEATEKSGSLITARLALEQGREVFAVPGEAGRSRSRGTHGLIRQGAKLVEGVEDILEEVAPQLVGALKKDARGPALRAAGLGADAQRVLELIGAEALHVDEIAERSGLSPARVLEILLRLEIDGLLQQLPGKRFVAS